MDFVSRHATSSSASEGGVGPSGSAGASASVGVAEEVDYIARYLVTKHSWRGRYKRILCISQGEIVTLDPGTLAFTNSYSLLNDFETAAPFFGRDDNAYEFTISVRTDGRGKFKIFLQVWGAYKDQKHDLFLPSNAQSAAAGVAGLIESSSGRLTYALTGPTPQPALVRLPPSRILGTTSQKKIQWNKIHIVWIHDLIQLCNSIQLYS